MSGSEEDAEIEAAIAELSTIWEVSALAQFYRVIGPFFLRKEVVAMLGDSDELERRLVEGSEATFVGMMLPLLAIGDDADSAKCWETVRELMESGAAKYFPQGGKEAAESPPASFSELTPGDRGRLLYALADASLDTFAKVDGSDPDGMRGERLGSDSAGRVYWRLGDCRVYREAAVKKKKGAPATSAGGAGRGWELAAKTGEQWRKLMKSLKKKGVEAHLSTALAEQVEAIEAKEAKVREEAIERRPSPQILAPHPASTLALRELSSCPSAISHIPSSHLLDRLLVCAAGAGREGGKEGGAARWPTPLVDAAGAEGGGGAGEG
jgi:hypothetical protein